MTVWQLSDQDILDGRQINAQLGDTIEHRTLLPGINESPFGGVVIVPSPPGVVSLQVTGNGGINFTGTGGRGPVNATLWVYVTSTASGNPGGSTAHPLGYKPHHALEGIPDMATQQSMAKWQEYTGPTPEGLGDLPFYDPARRADTIGETDTHWVKKERKLDGGIIVRIAEKLARGLGGNSQLGMKQGDAMIVDAAYAENAATAWGSPTSPNGNPYNANDVFDLVTPNGNIAGINDTVYVQFKDPPNAQLWKADPQGADVAYTPASQIDQTKLVPQAQIGSNGQPTVTPSGGGPGLITKFQTASTTTKIVIVGGGVLVLGALGLWLYGRLGKKHHAGGAHHAHHHRARASAPRRRRRGRGRR